MCWWGALFIAKFKGVFRKKSQLKFVSIGNKSSKHPSEDLAKSGISSFKKYLMFQVISAGGFDLALNAGCPQPMRLEHVLVLVILFMYC